LDDYPFHREKMLRNWRSRDRAGFLELPRYKLSVFATCVCMLLRLKKRLLARIGIIFFFFALVPSF
jgi:hypothetical protein